MTEALTSAPTLTTERLTLRGPTRRDFPFLEKFVTSGPDLRDMDDTGTRDDAWYSVLTGIGHWHWFGFGIFTLQKHGDENPIGRVGLVRQGGVREAEMIWQLYEGATGQGYATEAGARVRNWAAEAHGLTRLASYIHKNNTRSQAVATRLGATNSKVTPAHEPEAEIWHHQEAAA